jgi:hypothetical protein
MQEVYSILQKIYQGSNAQFFSIPVWSLGTPHAFAAIKEKNRAALNVILQKHLLLKKNFFFRTGDDPLGEESEKRSTPPFLSKHF